MNLQENNCNLDANQLQDQCKDLLYYHVVLTLKDGSTVDGIIGRVDDDQVIVLAGEDVMEDESRYGRPRPGGGRGRFRRFRPRTFPFGTIAALSLLAYPLLYPPYPYYYPYPYPYYPY